jgi:MFS transporter, DHA2 family, multidrug resistance protein
MPFRVTNLPDQSRDGLPNPQRFLAFLTVAVVLFFAVLDEAVVNVALPLLRQQFDAAPADVFWVVNAYRLAVIMVLLPVAALGDTLGYRRVYLSGIALFATGSLLCGFSQSLPMLVAARAIQGLGAAGIMGINIALVRFIYPRDMLGRAVGNTAAIIAISSATGPSIAGAILSVAPWQALFFINVPFALCAFLMGMRTLPRTPGTGMRIDVASAAIAAVTFGLLILGVNALSEGGGVAWPLALITLSVVFGFFFVRSQLRKTTPMLPVDLLQKPVFALSATTSVLSFSAQAMALTSLPFYLHDVLGHSAAETGLLMTPLPIGTAIAAFVSGRLADLWPPGQLAAVGLAIFSAGLAALALLGAEASSLDIAWRMALTGFGFGIFQAPNNKVLIASAPRERSGGAGAIQSTGRLLGQSLGVSVLAIVFGLAPNTAVTIGLSLAATLAALGVIPSAFRRVEAHQ